MIFIYVFLALLLNVVIAFLISLKYRFILRFIDKKISYFSAFIIVSVSSFLRYIIPLKGGAIVGTPVAAKIKENIDLDKSSIITVFENIFDTLWQLLLLILIFIFGTREFLSFYNIIVFLLLIIILVFIILKYENFIFIIFSLYRILPFKIKEYIKKIGIKREHVHAYFEKLKNLFSKKDFILLYSFYVILISIISPFSLIFLSSSYSLDLIYSESFIIYWVSFILGRLSGLPGGLGVRDFTVGALLISHGFSTAIALKIVFLYRLISFFPLFLTGAVYSLIYGREKLVSLYYNIRNLK